MKKQADSIVIVAPWPASDDLSDALRLLTQAIDFVGAADGRAGGVFGGEWGYGANYENDVFLMHRFCWCESDGCLWCGGSSCQSVNPREVHRDGCYQLRLQAFARQYGESLGVFEGREHYHVSYGSKHRKRYETVMRDTCREMGLTYPDSSACHCTCGVDREWKARYDACQCDWHTGRWIYRFGPAVEAPHFWHKPSGAQVRWYKYIGRDMEIRLPDGVLWPDVFAQCHESLRIDPITDPPESKP